MPFHRDSSNERHDDLFYVAHNGLEGNGLDIELVLPVEGVPLPLFRLVLKKLGRECDRRRRRESGLAALECPHDRFGEDLSLE
jgi:hypothetical protein